MASPGCRPAAAAGDSGWTSKKRTPTSGEASQAIPVKMTKARRTFITTPAMRIVSFLGRPWCENERGSSGSVPSSPSSFTKPPIGSQLRV